MKPDELLERGRALMDRIGGPRRAAILGAGVGVVALILAFSFWATAPAYVPLYQNVPLESVGQMTDQLQEAAIPFALDEGGSQISVPAPDLARARVALAGAGLGGEKARPGLELFDQPSWGMTDFSQRVNYRRALEGELERTIGRMRGIKAAQVHLAMSEQSSLLRGNKPTEASVVLSLQGGAEPEPAVVKGIAALVSGSVDGVRSEDVMVLDDAGRLLSSSAEPGSADALANRQLEMRREMEQYLESKATDLVAQAVGAGNARVRVTADLSFDRVERTTESVDPDRQAIASEQKSAIIPGPQGGAGSETSTATYENTRSLETFSSNGGTLKRLTVAVLVNEKPAAGGTGRTTPRAPAELERLQSLVSSAVGVDPRRGDVVSVVSLPFDGGAGLPVADEKPTMGELVREFQRPALNLLAILLAAYIALKLVRSVRPAEAARGDENGVTLTALPVGDGGDGTAAGTLAGTLAPAEPVIQLPPPPPTVLDRVTDVVRDQPDVAARLVRAWMKES